MYIPNQFFLNLFVLSPVAVVVNTHTHT